MARKPHVQRGAGNEAAVWARENGRSLAEAAERFGAVRQTVFVAWRRLFGDAPTPTGDQRSTRRSKLNREILRLVTEGRTQAEIARILQVADQIIAVRCRDLGLRPIQYREERRLIREAAIARIANGETAIDVAAETGLSVGQVGVVARAVLGEAPRQRSYVDRRDGRGARAAERIRAGSSIRAACEAERVSYAAAREALGRSKK